MLYESAARGASGVVLVGVVLVALAYAPSASAQTVTCRASCPPGTQLASFSEEVLKEVAEGAFVWVEQSCEATCAPITPCRWPNIPEVTAADGFACRPLAGYSALEPDAEVDLSFGVHFDPELARPSGGNSGGLGGRLTVRGTGFDPFEGLPVVLAVFSGDQQTLHARVTVTVSEGGFNADLSGLIPPGGLNLTLFVDANQDQACAGETVHIMFVQAAETGVAPEKLLVWGAFENASTNDALCPRIEEGL